MPQIPGTPRTQCARALSAQSERDAVDEQHDVGPPVCISPATQSCETARTRSDHNVPSDEANPAGSCCPCRSRPARRRRRATSPHRLVRAPVGDDRSSTNAAQQRRLHRRRSRFKRKTASRSLDSRMASACSTGRAHKFDRRTSPKDSEQLQRRLLTAILRARPPLVRTPSNLAPTHPTHPTPGE